VSSGAGQREVGGEEAAQAVRQQQAELKESVLGNVIICHFTQHNVTQAAAGTSVYFLNVD